MAPERVYTSVVVLGEIQRGIGLIARRDQLQSIVLQRWYASMRKRLADRVLSVDERVMAMWAKISVPDMLPAYDGLIAATVLVHSLIVATRNTADYRRVGLEVIDPWTEAPRPL